jgi:hypothetical protein
MIVCTFRVHRQLLRVSADQNHVQRVPTQELLPPVAAPFQFSSASA